MRLLRSTDWPVRRPMVLAGCVAAGASLLNMWLPPLVIFLIAAVLVLTCLMPWFRYPVWLYIVAFAAAFLCLGGAYRLSTVEPTNRIVGQKDTITATVIEVPSNGRMVTVEVTHAYTMPVGTRLLLYCNDQVTPHQGDTVTATVTMRDLYDTQRSYRADGVFLQAYPTAYGEDAMAVTPCVLKWRMFVDGVRERLLDGIRERLTAEEGALLCGICLGDRSDLSSQTATDFRAAGLPHLLVVSGLHLSVICGGVYAALRIAIPRRRVAVCLSMVAVLLFMILVGFTPSVVRAGVMCLVLLSGQLFRRRADGLNSMGLALLLLLAQNPYCLLDVGLLLSFGAAGGVLCLTKPIAESLYRVPIWKPIADTVAVTLAASLPIMPLLGLTFGEVSAVSPIANILAVAPSSVALVFGWLGMLTALCPPLSALTNGLLYFAGLLMRWVLWVARVLGSLPFATLTTDRAWTIVCLTGACILGILCLYSRARGTMRRMMMFLTALILISNGVFSVLSRGTTAVTVSTRGEQTSVLIEKDGTYGLVAPRAEDVYLSAAQQRACKGKLMYLVIGNGNPSHAASVTDLLQDVTVERLLVLTNSDWMAGLDLNESVFFVEREQTLSDGVTLTAHNDGGWSLSCGGAVLKLPADVNPSDACTHLTTRNNGEWSIRRWQ